MESAAEQAVHEVAAFGPEWLLVFFVIIVVTILLIAFIPLIKSYVEKKMELDQQEVDARNAREDERERRKNDELAAREQRDRERSEVEGRWATQYERAIAAQEKSNVVMTAISNQLEVMNTQLMDSKTNSKSMGETLARMDRKVEEIHRGLMR